MVYNFTEKEFVTASFLKKEKGFRSSNISNNIVKAINIKLAPKTS